MATSLDWVPMATFVIVSGGPEMVLSKLKYGLTIMDKSILEG